MEKRTEFRTGLLLLAAAFLGIGGGRLLLEATATPKWQIQLAWCAVAVGGLIFVGTMAWIAWPEKGQPLTPPIPAGRPGLSGALRADPKFSNPTIPVEFVTAQWEAQCEFISASQATEHGRGLLLSIQSRNGDTRDLHCIVTDPDGRRYSGVKRRMMGAKKPKAQEQFHFPAEFTPPLSDPWPTGYYPYVWTGDTADIADDHAEELARRLFYVDEAGSVTCHAAAPSEVATNQRTEPAADSLAEECQALSKDLYEFHRRHAGIFELAINPLGLSEPFMEKFETRMFSLYPRLLADGQSEESLAFFFAPRHTAPDVLEMARRIGVVGSRVRKDAGSRFAIGEDGTVA